jgi:hypothetical protein
MSETKKPAGDADAERNVDQIRDILFGGQMRDYERRFQELGQRLEAEMARLREAVICEWTETVNTPAAQTRFKHFINSTQRDPNVQVVPEREQHRPATPYERIPVTLVEENA